MRTAIEYWIQRQVKLAGAKGAVVGLSGGLDSSVVAALLRSSLGGRKVLALILPVHSCRQDMADARLIAAKFRLTAVTVDSSAIYDCWLKRLVLPAGVAGDDVRQRTAEANLKSRLRMSAFYYYANRLNYLVCGTSNRSEIMTGYFTKYGDGAADILPIGGLLKCQVRSLAVKLGMPQSIIDKPPSAGLWPGQTDEAEMGVTYGEIDEVLAAASRDGEPDCRAEAVFRIKNMQLLSEHKRAPARVFIPSSGRKR